MPQRVVDESGARRRDSRGNRPSGCQRRGRDSGFFEVACDQTDRLVADRSDRDQQRDVDFLIEQLARDRRGQLIAHLARGVDASHEGQSVGRQLADLAVGSEISKDVDRKHDVGIAPYILEIVGEVGGAQALGLDVGGDAAKRSVVSVVKGDLSRDVDAARADQRQATLGERARRP